MPRDDLIQLRGGTASQWTTAGPVLADREPGLETDTGKVKYGNGADSWSELPYAGGGGGGEEYNVQLSSGQTFGPEETAALVFDTPSEGLTLSDGGTVVEGFAPGTYVLSHYYEFAAPTENRFLDLGCNDITSAHWQAVVSAEGSSAARTPQGQSVVVLAGDVAFGMALITSVLSDEADPDDLVMSYGSVSFKRIG